MLRLAKRLEDEGEEPKVRLPTTFVELDPITCKAEGMPGILTDPMFPLEGWGVENPGFAPWALMSAMITSLAMAMLVREELFRFNRGFGLLR